MGADGHITIWRMDKMLEAFADAREIFALYPNSYTNKLDGVEYAHAYHGDNMLSDWRDFDDVSWKSSQAPPLERQHEFWKWMRDNTLAEWEVWT